ncbi:hypothetical protein MTR62_10110 [Novosphingobium sp. 1949]|uniref:Uncharacterized protein n=1 Tax=Novosphingobium organovorum TaxID=2930092 RepID=A0ABT0BDR4_9SPHN|nr:hypothetical protein [Novosphingobium organovorum]MCJ2183045.1 hypothetical protein [Novosphingobium organovorum]
MTIGMRGRLALGLIALAAAAVLAIAWIGAGPKPVEDQVIPVAVPAVSQ